MIKQTVKIAAIILTYGKRDQYLKNCLDSLLNQSYPFFKIYLVDNDSSEETKILIQQYLKANKNIESINFSDNKGSAAYGLAMRIIQEKNNYDWLFLCDDDGLADQNLLYNFVHSSCFNNKTALLSAKRIDLSGKIETHERGFFNILKLEVEPLKNELYNQDHCEIEHSSYMGMLINSLALKQIGYPNDNFYLYLDDIDFSLRLGKYGARYLITNAVVTHAEPKSNRQEISLGVVRTKTSDLWRDYYNFRNYFLLRKSTKHPLFMLAAIGARFIRSFCAIIVLDKNKFVRMKYLSKAFKDGFSKKFGQTLNIYNFKKELENGK